MTDAESRNDVFSITYGGQFSIAVTQLFSQVTGTRANKSCTPGSVCSRACGTCQHCCLPAWKIKVLFALVLHVFWSDGSVSAQFLFGLGSNSWRKV